MEFLALSLAVRVQLLDLCIMHLFADNFDQPILWIGYQVAANAFVLVEVLRIFRVPPFGAYLQRFMEPFVDQRDQGVAVLTHVYLLLGCAIPIWCDVVLRSVSNENKQPRLVLRPTMLPFSGLVRTTRSYSYAMMLGSITLATVIHASLRRLVDAIALPGTVAFHWRVGLTSSSGWQAVRKNEMAGDKQNCGGNILCNCWNISDCTHCQFLHL